MDATGQVIDTATGEVVQRTFPYHKCSDYSNASLPYVLTPPVAKGGGLYCMKVLYNGPVSNPSYCYSTLTNLFTSIVIGVSE